MSLAENVLALPAHVSHSQVSTWSKCGRQYLLERVLRMETQPQGALLGGSAVHDALDAALTEELSSHDAQLRFIDLFAGSVKDAGGAEAVRWGGRRDKTGKPGEDESWWLANGVKFVDRGMLLLTAFRESGYEIVSHEAQYAFEVEGRQVVAKPDLVLAHGEGTVVVVDYKTGAIARGPQHPIQLAIYCVAVSNTHGFEVEQVIGQVANLRKDGPEGLITYNPALYIDLAMTLIRDFIAGTDAAVFPMSPSPMCVACGVKAHCDYGKTLDPQGGDE